MIGGSDAELRLLARAVAALTERLQVCGRTGPALLDDVREQLRDWGGLEETDPRCDADLGEGDDVMAPLLLTRTEAARLVRLSERQVAREVADGRLRVVRVGRATRIHPADLRAYVDELARTSGKGVA